MATQDRARRELTDPLSAPVPLDLSAPWLLHHILYQGNLGGYGVVDLAGIQCAGTATFIVMSDPAVGLAGV